MKQSQLLENINIQLSVDVQWQPLLHAGTTNQLYTGNYQGQAVVLRLDTTRQVLGVCRQREEKVLSLLGTKAWAPEVFQQKLPDETQSGWLLMKRYTTLDDAPIADLHAQILACVSDWQQIRSMPTYDYQALWDAYQQKINDLDNTLQAQALLSSVCALMLELNITAKVELCLVHHDLHKRNLLNNVGQLVVIDWEYAGLGNPWLDAAALVTEFSIPHLEIASLPAFRDVDSKAFECAINIALQVNRQLSLLWYELSGHSDQ
ncbi:phosphotransferase [Neptunomonas japonica]|uniref:Thiamine kinase n=1 Tax=Neptunomonas japonica JAMM 1380 TaxID=1441457 RepID=A0A7R6PHM1_9GAMM|nr:phosphotransferase [Neptunomonas japonica]BBB30382.1 thiamine kinase [Neptunomonas japonica JAMM 1380]